ncbi:MAG: multifunctional CCA tRNA nucleotidyl transferase/2'3'-cyclic phosphodiesterase/2'nucleotidase/phosphatase [Gammaproteobacteria bacterium]
MKIYLVGGAVRDELLGLEVSERDWVVVGATPEEMESRGYRRVGRDFPVFLHPDSGEDYALARTERKRGRGHTGFECDASPNVTLEQDLERRDLTVNAIAKDGTGELIDPFGGIGDLQAHVLRHVSDAFAEDPLRVLRVARFAARFASMHFRVADETIELMSVMARSGELDSLTFRALERADAGTLDPESAFALLWLGRSAEKVERFAARMKLPSRFRDLALLVARKTDEIAGWERASANELLELLKSVDALRRPARFAKLMKIVSCARDDTSTGGGLEPLEELAAVVRDLDVSEIVATAGKADVAAQVEEARVRAIEEWLERRDG